MYSQAELEHIQHEAGAFRNEHQAAYALSRSETKIVDQTPLIRKWVSKGLYVAVQSHEVCCRFTDAILGYEVRIVGVCRDRARAVAMLKLGNYPEDENSYVTPAAPETSHDRRIAAIPDWYWNSYPDAKAKVLSGDDELLSYIEEKIEDWRTDPLA